MYWRCSKLRERNSFNRPMVTIIFPKFPTLLCLYLHNSFENYHILDILGHGSKCLDIMGSDILGIIVFWNFFNHTTYLFNEPWKCSKCTCSQVFFAVMRQGLFPECLIPKDLHPEVLVSSLQKKILDHKWVSGFIEQVGSMIKKCNYHPPTPS